MKKVIPKKHIGQHFLKDDRVAQKIVRAMDQNAVATLIEVGSGTGALTKHLLGIEDFLTFDIDRDSVDYLKSAYPENKEKILLQDFLHYDLAKSEAPIGVIGNFPYNISSQLFFKIWDNRNLVKQVVCMLQKEVADRIVAKGGKAYGILSVLLQAFYDIEYLFTVSPGVFEPPPKVNSAVIGLKRNQKKSIDCNEQLFKKVVKSGFGKRRKTLRNALKDLNLPFSVQGAVFDKRAEQLTVEDFIHLTRYISQ